MKERTVIRNRTINLTKAICLFGILLLLFACNTELDIQQSYEFDVQIMPLPKDIKQNETIEIRCSLTESGNFKDNRYTIRYFQFEGEGKLHLGKEGKAFSPNDRYAFLDKDFRLYYTSLGDKSHTFEVVIENSFGTAKKLEFKFTAKNKE